MNIEEIQQAITADPTLKTGLTGILRDSVIDAVKADGFVVRSTDEEAAFLTNYERTRIDPRVSKIYSDLDNDVEEASGVKRDVNEKTFAYTKRVISGLKSQIDDLSGQIETLKAGKGDELTRQQLETLQASLREKNAELDNLKNSSSSEIFKLKVGFNVDKALSDVKIFVPQHIADGDKDAYISSRKNYIKSDFASNFKAEELDGNIIYKDANGVIQTDTATAAPKTEAQLIAEKYKFEFEPANPPGGGAGSGKGGNDPAKLLASVNDKDTLYEYLSKKGLIMGSADWIKERNEVAKQLNIPL